MDRTLSRPERAAVCPGCHEKAAHPGPAHPPRPLSACPTASASRSLPATPPRHPPPPPRAGPADEKSYRFDTHAKNNELTTATMLLLRTNELNLVFPPGSSRGLEYFAQAANPHSPRYQRSRSLLLWWLLLFLSLSLSSSSSRRARSVT